MGSFCDAQHVRVPLDYNKNNREKDVTKEKLAEAVKRLSFQSLLRLFSQIVTNETKNQGER